MYFLLFLATITIVYIASFKDNFTAEHIQKTAPVIAAVSVLFFISECPGFFNLLIDCQQ